MNALRMYAAMAAGTAAVAAGVWQWIRSHRTTPEQRERQRRQRLAQIGRICDGTVLDVQEISANGHGPNPAAHLLLRRRRRRPTRRRRTSPTCGQFLKIYSFKLGLSGLGRYDPHNPGNSIVISESLDRHRNGTRSRR